MKSNFSVPEQTAQPVRGPVFQESLTSILSLTGTFPGWLFLFWRCFPNLPERQRTRPMAQGQRAGASQNRTTQTGINGWFIAYSQGNIREGPD